MTLDNFRESLAATEPPAGLTLALAGLWWDGKGDWKRAHESAQQDEGMEGAWVHAYLHRKEGDQGNAAYWIRSSEDDSVRLHSLQLLPQHLLRNGWYGSLQIRKPHDLMPEEMKQNDKFPSPL